MSDAAVQAFRQFVNSLGAAYAPGDIYASTGRPVDARSSISHLGAVLDHLARSTASSDIPFRYCAGLIQSVISTGHCSSVAGHYCFGATTAFYFGCLESAFRLFQADTMFPEVGRPDAAAAARMRSAAEHPWGFLFRAELDEHVKASPANASAPFDAWDVPRYRESMRLECPLRMKCAYYVAETMMRFIWTHEFAHAIGGHIRYLQHRKSFRVLSENDWYEDSQEDRYLYSALRMWIEHDADTSAIRTLLLSTLRGEVLTRTAEEQIDQHPELRVRLEVMAFVLALLLILFQYDWQSGEGKHPDPLKRIFVAVSSAIDLVRTSLADDTLTLAVMDDVRLLVQANRTHHMPLAIFFTPIASEMAFDEYNGLVAQVSPVIPEIRRYSYYDADGKLTVPD